MEQWPLVVADFASHYGIRLHAATDLSWVEFRDLLFGLLNGGSRLFDHFTRAEGES